MSSKTLGKLMRISVISMTVCGLFLCLFLIPHWGQGIVYANPELSGCFWPWLIFAWLVALPCFAVLVLIWKVAGAVEKEAVFTLVTAKWVKAGAILLLCVAALLFFGNVLLLLLNMNLLIVLILSVILDIFIITLALIAAAGSRYLTKAAELQEESEGIL